MMMLVQLVTFINIICQNMQQSNITSFTGLLPSICKGRSQRFASLKTCPGFKADHVNPLSVLKPEISLNFDLDSANGITVNSSGFAVKKSYIGKKAVNRDWAILTNKSFDGLTPKYWAFETICNTPYPVNTIRGSFVLFKMAFASKTSLYKIIKYVVGAPGRYGIMFVLSKGDIELSAYHSEDIQEGHPKTIIPAPKTNTKVIKLEIGVVVDLARKRILLINVDTGEVITEFTDVDTAQPLWTMFILSSMDCIRIEPKHILEKHLRTTLIKLQKSWDISNFDLLGPNL